MSTGRAALALLALFILGGVAQTTLPNTEAGAQLAPAVADSRPWLDPNP